MDSQPATRSKEQIINIYGPDFELELTVLDHGMCNIYPASGLVFKLPPTHDKDNITTILHKAYQSLVNEIPWLASTVKLESGRFTKVCQKLLTSKSSPTKSNPIYTVHSGHAELAIQRSSPLFYTKMKFPDFVEDLYANVPRIQNGVTILPASGIKAVFTADGYLLLGFELHHSLADGGTHMRIVERLAEHVRQQSGESPAEQMISPYPDALGRSLILDNTPTATNPSDLPIHPTLKILTAGEVLKIASKLVFTVLSRDWRKAFVRKSFCLSTTALGKLKADIPLGARVSTHDLACGLLWQSIIAARHANGVVHVDKDAAFAMPADIRSKLPPNTSNTAYLGNAVIMVSAKILVSTLLSPGGVISAALAIRDTINTVLDLKVFQDQLAMFSSAPDPIFVASRALDVPFENAVFLTSRFRYSPWVWDWGPGIGELMSYHYPVEQVLDVVMIPPVNKDGTMNVLLGMEGKYMDSLRKDESFLKYAKEI